MRWVYAIRYNWISCLSVWGDILGLAGACALLILFIAGESVATATVRVWGVHEWVSVWV